jgi:hypothetical protein
MYSGAVPMALPLFFQAALPFSVFFDIVFFLSLFEKGD